MEIYALSARVINVLNHDDGKSVCYVCGWCLLMTRRRRQNAEGFMGWQISVYVPERFTSQSTGCGARCMRGNSFCVFFVARGLATIIVTHNYELLAPGCIRQHFMDDTITSFPVVHLFEWPTDDETSGLDIRTRKNVEIITNIHADLSSRVQFTVKRVAS